ncbi:MAG TPA: hypothetical protein VIJ92_01885 [Ginsengibacter sp.]
MKEILKSTLLQYEKSTFLIDLTKHHSGQGYINIQQTIEGIDIKQELKINFSVLSDIISILQIYQKAIDTFYSTKDKSYFNEDKQKSVVERYLKGVSIKDLALQFDCNNQIIEQILFNKGIKIIDQSQPKGKRGQRNRRM